MRRPTVEMMLILLPLCVALLAFGDSANGLSIGFSEDDYSAREGDGRILIRVVKSGENNGSITVQVTPVTVEHFEQLFGATLIPAVSSNTDPAEDADFMNGTYLVVFPSSPTLDEEEISISITNDDIQEPEELFLLYLEVTDGSGTDLNVIRNVSVARIRSDGNDIATVSLRAPSATSGELSFTEGVGAVNDAIYIVREGETEQVLEITLQLSDLGTTEGQDYEVVQITYLLQPSVSNLTVPISIIDDGIVERRESFEIVLQSSTDYQSGPDVVVTVSITDNDAITVGFLPNQTSLVVQEGGEVELCVALLAPEEVDITLDFTISAEQYLSAREFFLESEERRFCTTVEIEDDDKLERSRNFTAKLESIDQTANPLHIIDPDTVTVTITDNDGTPRAPEILEIVLVNDNKDLLIEWSAEATELRPIDFYTGIVHVRGRLETVSKRQADPDTLRFRTESDDTREILPDVDITKQYEIQICSWNDFGSACSDPVVFTAEDITPSGLVTTVVEPAPITETPVLVSTPLTGGIDNKKEETGVASWLIALIVILLLLLLLLCCLLLLIVFCCFLKERGRNYFPEKREKKHAEDFAKYRRGHSSGSDADSDFEEKV